MNIVLATMLAVLSIWDYPERQPRHEQLKTAFIAALKAGDTSTMTETCRRGVELLPDDPTWHYNLACSLAYFKDQTPALDELEKAIDLGFRDADAIARDSDLHRLAKNPRFDELVEYARRQAGRPMLVGPLATVPAVGVFGKTVALGAQNMVWDFDSGCFVARMNLTQTSNGGNVGDLYVNRDANHSRVVVTNWPGLTEVVLDREGRERRMDLDFPNTLYPYPVFGNASRGYSKGPYWRSLPRALMTYEARRMSLMCKMYCSNQLWVFPAVDDYNFSDTNYFGDVFASVSPYWITTQGRSWSDQPYLRGALEASRSFSPAVKRELVKRGMLSPTIQVLLRKSLKGVNGEDDYISSKAHPTAMPPNGFDTARLKKAAASLKISEIPPLATIAMVAPEKTSYTGHFPEITYATPCAWAFVLRAAEPVRSFLVKVRGGDEYAFAAVHDEVGAARVERIAPDTAKITIDKTLMTTTNRVDFAAFAKTGGSGWGAPAYVSFAVMDPSAPYSDPVLTQPEVKTE